MLLLQTRWGWAGSHNVSVQQMEFLCSPHLITISLTLSNHQGKLSDLIKVVFNKKWNTLFYVKVKSLPLHPSFCEDCFGKLSDFPTMNFNNKITKRKIFSEHPLLLILQFLLLTVVCYSLRRVKYHNWLSKFCVGI